MHILEWLKLTTLTIPSVDEETEYLEFSFDLLGMLNAITVLENNFAVS